MKKEDKYCPRCDTIKPKLEFYKSKARYDGVMSCCKSCKSKENKAKYSSPYKELNINSWAKRN